MSRSSFLGFKGTPQAAPVASRLDYRAPATPDPNQHRGDRTSIVLELLGAILDADACPPADVFVIGALVGVLEATPTADVVNQDGVEFRLSALNIPDQPLQRIATFQSQAALAFVGIGPDDLDAALGRIAPDRHRLVFGGVLLVLRGHADILGRRQRACGYGKMLPKKGRIFPRGEDRRQREPNYAMAVGSALQQELGDSHQATKTVMRWTGAGERTVKNWFAGTSGPRGEHLLALVRHSDAIFDGEAGVPSQIARMGRDMAKLSHFYKAHYVEALQSPKCKGRVLVVRYEDLVYRAGSSAGGAVAAYGANPEGGPHPA
jgi:hypothetical protein